MERESFEDEEVADFLNVHFVSIKVDREERPDVDTIYMNVCQALTGSGGWPLTVIMTHDKKPFFAGTYFPKNDRMGLQGLMTILKAVSVGWENNRKLLLESGDKITEFIAKKRKPSMASISEDIFDETFLSFQQYFDPTYGGFGHAPKFPTPHNLMLLLRYWKRTNNPAALQMVEKTLDSMYKGGIYDHIGFGFCRYSTDHRWLVPHFEKMLYDNALLAITYLETYQATKKEKYGLIAQDILSYSKGQEIIISTHATENAKPYTDIINERFSPFSVSMVYTAGDETLAEISPFLESYNTTPGKTEVYVCEKHSCKAPITDFESFKEVLL